MPESTIATVTSAPVVWRQAVAAPMAASPSRAHCSPARGSVAVACAARAVTRWSGTRRSPSGAATRAVRGAVADAPGTGASARAAKVAVVMSVSARGTGIRPPCRMWEDPRRGRRGHPVVRMAPRLRASRWPDGRVSGPMCPGGDPNAQGQYHRGTMFDRLAVPIVQAPMAGGPSTPALAAAVTDAGGLGFVAAGYRTAGARAADIAAARAPTAGPIAVNVFAPSGAPADPAVVAAYAARLEPEARRGGVALGTPRFDADAYAEKVALLAADPVAAVSFTFGCPDAGVVGALRDAGTAVWVTVTDPQEARIAAAAGADALVVQGAEAGGHRGAFADRDDRADRGLLALLQLVRAAT